MFSMPLFQRQLDIECKVKAGADNMIVEYSSNHKGTDKKLLMEAQQMSQVSQPLLLLLSPPMCLFNDKLYFRMFGPGLDPRGHISNSLLISA